MGSTGCWRSSDKRLARWIFDPRVISLADERKALYVRISTGPPTPQFAPFKSAQPSIRATEPGKYGFPDGPR